MQLKQRQTYLDTRVERNGLYHLPAEGQKVQSWDVVFWKGAAVVSLQVSLVSVPSTFVWKRNCERAPFTTSR